MEFAMSWLVGLMLTAMSAVMVVGLPRFPHRATRAPWWRGRELLASVVHFCLALGSLVLMGLALGLQVR